MPRFLTLVGPTGNRYQYQIYLPTENNWLALPGNYAFLDSNHDPEIHRGNGELRFT